jgi:hypothetical protein
MTCEAWSANSRAGLAQEPRQPPLPITLRNMFSGGVPLFEAIGAVSLQNAERGPVEYRNS